MKEFYIKPSYNIYGNIIHYNKNGEEVDDDDPTKILNSSRNYLLNIILLFCYILLFA